jgi:DNA-binding MarR family transcriptional regulator/GNAT superfamily N-acetyltransferase
VRETRLSSAAEDVPAFRQFNRMYTRLIGTLDEGLLSTEYSLAEARVLYELATRAEPNASEIAESLGIDPGYLSRILNRFESSRLIRRKVSKQDSRCSTIVLTRRGRSAFDTLNALSDKQARTILERLTLADRGRLSRSMQVIEEIFVKDVRQRPPYVLRPHRPGDMGWVVYREGALYAEEYGFDGRFEALVAGIVADFVTNFDPKRERCWMAEIDGEPAGHIFLVRHPERPDSAKLRLLLVEPSARGKGLGHASVSRALPATGRSRSGRRAFWWLPTGFMNGPVFVW